MSRYIPDRGDLIWLEFDPQAGYEQAGRRPALVLSPLHYNRLTHLLICCPITSRVKDYPFEVALPNNLEIEGVVLADQVKNLDWHTRKARFIAKVPAEVISEALSKLQTLFN